MNDKQTMVERVARVLCRRAGMDPDSTEDGSWPRCPPPSGVPAWMAWERDARLVIGEMREPSKAMVDKAWAMIGSNLRYEEVYPYLIDAALSDPEATP